MNYTSLTLRVALLASMSSVAWAAADEGGGGGGGGTLPLEEALKRLSLVTDGHWTEGGLPLIEHLKGLTGSDVTRAEVDAITDGTKRDAWAEWRKTKWSEYAEGALSPADPDVVAAEDEAPAPALTKEEKVAEDVASAEQKRSVSSSAPEQPPVAGAVLTFRGVDQGDDVIVTWPGEQTLTLTGVRHSSKWKESAVDSPLRNLPWFDVPTRKA